MTNKSTTPDLEIQVSSTELGSSTRLRFVLHSPNGAVDYTYFKVDGETHLSVQPRVYQAQLLTSLEVLNLGLSDDESPLTPIEVEQELEKIGRALYEDLFPRALKAEYERFRSQVTTLLVVSDEPWIPWEMVKPSGRDFLCCQFQMTRWLAGGTTPSDGLGATDLGTARIVGFQVGGGQGRQSGPQSEAELDNLKNLADRHSGVESLRIQDASFGRVEEVLRLGGNGILHFLGHGVVDRDHKGSPRLPLSDGRSLRPRDLLYDGIENRIRQDRPLVFFNLCHGARQEHGLTRLGGWASRWILDCGCGAFIGPQWSVRDEAGACFASEFYEAMERGESIASAAQIARRAARRLGGSSWLSYAVYARPGARLRLGLGPTPLRIQTSRWRVDFSPPGALLRAEYGIVPFHGRDDELANLMDWARSDADVQVRLYTGAGGMGKTRLALELCRKMQEQGWQAGFLSPDPSRTPDEIWKDLQGRDQPALVVVDYAETRRHILVPFFRRLYESQGGKFRVVLLARAALDWWERLKSEGEGVGELLCGPSTRWLTLMPLATSLDKRRESYWSAIRSFSKYLGKPIPETEPRGLGEAHFERVLLLHMKALVDLRGAKVEGEDGILDYVLLRERRFWGRLVTKRGLPSSLAEGIGRVMALITLGGGVKSESHAIDALHALQLWVRQDHDLIVSVARLLHESYPGVEHWIEPMLPDLLGEHLIETELARDGGELLDLVLGTQHQGSYASGESDAKG